MAELENEVVNQAALESDCDYMHVDFTPTTSDRDEDAQTNLSNISKNTLFCSSLFEEVDEEKLALRASRFGIESTNMKVTITESETNSLYKSLGIDNQDNKNGKIRFNVIHMRGVEQMNTQNVLDYFKNYSPESVEWINDNSCNVVWKDLCITARAILDLSRPVKISPPIKNNSAKEFNEEIVSEPEEGEDVEMAEQESGEERVRHTSADSDTQQSHFRRNSGDQSGTPVPNNSPVDSSQIDDTSGLEEIDSSKIEIPVPPGHWRLGVPTEKAKALLLRFAFRTDRKMPGSEKLSQYYVKHGNPNYKGMKGMISTSFKKKINESRKRPHYVDLDAPADDDRPFQAVRQENEIVVQEQTKRPRMRMYADEEEEKQKNRSITSSGSSTSLHPADLRNRIIQEKSVLVRQTSSDDLRSRIHSRQPWNTPQEEESFDQELADVQSLLKPRSLSMPVVMGDLRNKLEKLRQSRQPKVPLLIEVSQDDA